MTKNPMRRISMAARDSRRAVIVLTIALTSGAAFVATRSVAADPLNKVNVDITQFMFGPKELTVAPGTTVHWINHDEVPHTVASQDKSKPFASKAMDTDDSYEFSFAREGDYGYVCTVHPFMTGVLHVRKR